MRSSGVTFFLLVYGFTGAAFAGEDVTLKIQGANLGGDFRSVEGTGSPADDSGDMLFLPVEAESAKSCPGQHPSFRSRIARISKTYFKKHLGYARDGGAAKVGKRFEVNPFPKHKIGLERTKAVEAWPHSESNYSVWAKGTESIQAQAILVVKDGAITGTISDLPKSYTIYPLHDGLHCIIDIDDSKFRTD